MDAAHNVANKSDSLIENVTNNSAELYNSIVAKFVGGKRINFSLRNSYAARCDAAVLSMNNKEDFHRKIQLGMGSKKIGKYTIRYEEIKNRINRNRKRRGYKKRKNQSVCTADKNYGPTAETVEPDMTVDQYEKEKTEFLHQLKNCDAKNIFENTLGQFTDQKWREDKRKRLTASNFGRICKKRKSTSTANIVRSLLYNTFIRSKATTYGIKNEENGLKALELYLNKKIKKSGLIIDENNVYLAASPDGIVDEDTICEIKCPYNAQNLKIKEAVEKNIIKFLEINNGKIQLKTNDNYMYQIQGQLQVCNKSICYFVVWTEVDVFIEKITRNESYWTAKMQEQLKNFYFNSYLLELLDSRYARDLPIRVIS